MGSLSNEDICKFRDEITAHFNDIIKLNGSNFKKMANGEISRCTGIAPDGILEDNLQFYTDDMCIYLCFGHNNLLTVFKNHVDTFINNNNNN